jgi:2-iminoacetate synthase ThiH
MLTREEAAALVELDARKVAGPTHCLAASARAGSLATRRRGFIVLTTLCRNVCHYCSFPNRRGAARGGT